MPATSKAQQALMGQAYAVKKGKLDPSDLDPRYRDEIVRLSKEMTEKDLKDYAETSHEGLPDRVGENNTTATTGSVNGMGSTSMPSTDGGVGSGDIPHALGATAAKQLESIKFMRFNQFINKSK